MATSGRSLTEAEVAELWRLRLLGWSTRRVAVQLGLSRTTVKAKASQRAVDERRRMDAMRAALRAEIRAEDHDEKKSDGSR